MQHKWQRGESVQWGERGLGYDAAATPYYCETCGAKFVHRYHIQPNIYKAMEEAGITNDDCKPTEWLTPAPTV